MAIKISIGVVALGLMVLALNTVLSCSATKSQLTLDRESKKEQSPQWDGKKFVNKLDRVDGSMWSIMRDMWTNDNEVKKPEGDDTVQHVKVDPEVFKTPPKSGLRVTWMGHSSMLIEIDGYTVLTDPIWSKRASPVQFAGPKRFFDPVVALDKLPKLDAIIISHDHYDHLDETTIKAMKDHVELFAVPLGVGEHLEDWGVDPNKITEIDWWEEIRVGKLVLTATPARHFSGRSLADMMGGPTLWAGWSIAGDTHKVFYSGDTAMQPAFYDIGDKLGPFDITFIESGAYNPLWADVHIGPEQAVLAHKMLQGKVMMPVHWSTFDLANHNWTEPAERIIAAAQKENVEVIIPRPGQSFEPTTSPKIAKWWPEVKWDSAKTDPIVSSNLDSNLYNRLQIASKQIVMADDSTMIDSLVIE